MDLRRLLAVDFLTLGLAVSVLFLPGVRVFRLALGIPFLFFSPGYVLAAAVYPEDSDLNWLERSVFSVGGSLALITVGGIALNYTPWGLNLLPLLATFLPLMSALSVVGWVRAGEAEGSASGLPSPATGEGEGIWGRWTILSALVLIGAVAAGALLVAQGHEERFTGFYILNENGSFEDVSGSLTVRGRAVQVRVKNHERGPENYRMVVRAENRVLERVPAFTVEQGDVWGRELDLMVRGQADVEFLLFRGGGRDPYRKLSVRLGGAGEK